MADTQAPEGDREDLAELAARTVVSNAVALITTMAVAAGISYLLTHRYAVEQARRRALAWYEHKRNPGRVAEAAAVAELQRELSTWEHEQANRGRIHPFRVPGLYERGA